jgi:hypothetical protein
LKTIALDTDIYTAPLSLFTAVYKIITVNKTKEDINSIGVTNEDAFERN